MDDDDLENDELLQGLLPKIISREEWGAKNSRKKRKLKHPIKRIVFSSSNISRCYSKAHCIHNVKKYQEECLDNSRNDMPHNFLIGSDGRVYEGMGWNYQADCIYSFWIPSERPLKELHETSIEVAFIGPKEIKPGMKQIKAALGLLIMGTQNKILSEDMEVIESNVVGPIFPKDNLMKDKGEFQETENEDIKNDMTDDEFLEFLNQDLEEEDAITKEQMLEELKDEERLMAKFKEFDEQLKIENQKYIEENYPWHFKTKQKKRA